MRIVHVVGARPNFMKVSPVMAALSRRTPIAQSLIHTGQHYDRNMSEVFFTQLGLPQPDINLEVGSGSHAEQTANIMLRFEKIMKSNAPGIVLVYGDVNSTLAAAVVCSKMGIPIGHVEAGLRSNDRTMPEEINRILTDHAADILFTPSIDADRNLEKEGIDPSKVKLVGNVMIDTLVRLLPRAEELWQGQKTALRLDGSGFGLVTLHRASNVDSMESLLPVVRALESASKKIPLIFPVHPRTRKKLSDAGARIGGIRYLEPLGYLEFLCLQRHARFVLTDSGGIQEETTYLGVPCLTLRKNTERPITIEMGTNYLVGDDIKKIPALIEDILAGKAKKGSIPPLWEGKAAERIADCLENLHLSA